MPEVLAFVVMAISFGVGVLFERSRSSKAGDRALPEPSRLGGWRVVTPDGVTNFEVADAALLAALSTLTSGPGTHVELHREFGGDTYDLWRRETRDVEVRRGSHTIAVLRPEMVEDLMQVLAEGDPATAAWTSEMLLGLGSIDG